MNGKKGYTIEYYDELSSTNEHCKARRGERKNLIVAAKRQTGGRGTKGRSFSSEEGGVYLSVLTFYEALPAKNAFLIMANAATAVCRTLEAFGVKPVIKWANDVFVNGKKICGILIENTFSGAFVDSSVVGIGVNIGNPLPDELKEIATSILLETGKRVAVAAATERLIEELQKTHTIEDYLSYIGYMGERATLVCGEDRLAVTLLSVDHEGGLHVRTKNGEEKKFVAAEVSLRLGEKK